MTSAVKLMAAHDEISGGTRAGVRVSNTVAETRPLIAHIIHRLDVGGLENGLVNLINRTPQYRHAVICMTEHHDFARRIRHDAVALYALHKREGKDIGVYLRLWRLLRQLRPAIVHTRNLATLEGQLPAWLAGVPGRIHGEHGWDVHDLDGSKYRWLRRLYRPLVQRYIPLSCDLERYLTEQVKADAAKITQIYNGVDVQRFYPSQGSSEVSLPEGFANPGTVIVGTVGRMEAVKDPLNLVNAFALLLKRNPACRDTLRLIMVGTGTLHAQAGEMLRREGAESYAWLPGARDDIPELLRCMDIFVLPSCAEGISNTILEAMASGLPVVATRVGGNSELVMEDETGQLVAAADPAALADALDVYLRDPPLRLRHGNAGRERVVKKFSMEAMVTSYAEVYESVLAKS